MRATASPPSASLRYLMHTTIRLILASAAVAACPVLSSAQLNIVPFDVRVPVAPTAVQSDGAAHLVYELHVTNMGSKARAISRLEVLRVEGGAPPGDDG